ncbi:hypothetical protein TTHERM_00527140 (macronuclear) [Tetrahymena thermophila SB210]|uniref:Uncharacterized protein n=1 Tax=Tetrahymena thermophila (strain SB210) TaxID=312017 RepID=I7MN42_TETTS|nr:hypothetical protein TTHERM_00527140 [Tetrahymena thermophila SB210]EAS07877.2 hypothetical protein TTHERM_00527140 [Tetrahymena thermophila SB210]|eukprot:XP_001028119.2 hypothetical protein TTHERM_00527140 [Tetrahymena thermophila SB210]
MEVEDSNCNSNTYGLALSRKTQLDNDSSCCDEEDLKKKQQRIYNLMDFYKQRNEKYKKVEFDYSHIERFILPEKEVYIIGDMIVEDFLDKSEPSQIVRASNWQCWRRAIKVEFRKDILCLETINENTAIGLCEMKQVVKMLQSKGDQQLYNLSCLLANYQKVIDIILGVKADIMAFLKIYPNIQQLQDQVFQKWLEDCYKWIKKNMKQEDIYTYEVGRIDFKKLEHQEYMFGVSKSLLDLLGTDENTAVNIALRFGKIEFYTEETRYINITQKLIFALTQTRDPNRVIKYDIITLDGIVIPVQAKIECPVIPLSSEQIFSYNFLYQFFNLILQKEFLDQANSHFIKLLLKYQQQSNIKLMINTFSQLINRDLCKIITRVMGKIFLTLWRGNQVQLKKLFQIFKIFLFCKIYFEFYKNFNNKKNSTLLLEKFYKNEYKQQLNNSNQDIKRCLFTEL